LRSPPFLAVQLPTIWHLLPAHLGEYIFFLGNWYCTGQTDNPMQMNKLTGAWLIALFLSSPLITFAQSPQDTAAALMQGELPLSEEKDKKERSVKPQRIPVDETTFLNHFGIGASIGTKNYIGADLLINIVSQLHVRLGYNRFEFEFDDVHTSVSGFANQDLSFTGTIQQNNVEVLFEWGILNGRVRFVGGPVITIDNEIQSDFRLTEDIQINDITIPAEEVGSGDVSVTHSFTVFPYVGIGFGRSLPWRRFGVNLDVGTYYKGTTQVRLGATGLIRANEDNEDIINRNLRDEPVSSLWPVVSLRLAYRIY